MIRDGRVDGKSAGVEQFLASKFIVGGGDGGVSLFDMKETPISHFQSLILLCAKAEPRGCLSPGHPSCEAFQSSYDLLSFTCTSAFSSGVCFSLSVSILSPGAS